MLLSHCHHADDTTLNSCTTAMNFRHQSHQQDLDEKRLLIEHLTIGLITKEHAQKHMSEIDEAAKDLALIAAGGQPSPSITSNKSASHTDPHIYILHVGEYSRYEGKVQENRRSLGKMIETSAGEKNHQTAFWGIEDTCLELF